MIKGAHVKTSWESKRSREGGKKKNRSENLGTILHFNSDREDYSIN